jgi:type VI protein secretion system component Hcp
MVAKRRKTVGKSKQSGVSRKPKDLDLPASHAGAVKGGDKAQFNEIVIVKKIDKASP